MAVVVINKLPCFLSLPYCKLFLSRQQHQVEDYRLGCKIQENPSQKTSTIRACSIKSSKRSRGSRKVKSNAELCNDLRNFLSAAGLPEAHVPSMKELSDHGRTDLAKIVRRRGYKVIRDLLLSNSLKKDFDASDMQQSITDGQDAARNRDTQTGQDEKVDDIKGDGLLSSEVFTTESLSCTTDIDNSYSHSCMSVDVPVNFSLEEKALYNAQVQHEDVESMAEESSLSAATYNTEQQDEEVKLVDDNSLSTPIYSLELHDNGIFSMVENASLSNEVFISDTHHDSSKMCPNLNSNDNVSKHVDNSTSFPSKDVVTFNPEDQHEKIKNMINDIPPLAGASSTEYHVNNVSGINFTDHGLMHMDFTFNSSLEEKAANFIQNGDLDIIEYDVCDMSKLERSTDIQSKNLSERSFGHIVDGSNAALTLNGSLSTSKPVPHVTVDHPVRNDQLSGNTLVNGDSDKDLDIETSKQWNQVEINNLNFMLVLIYVHSL
uniref:Uncharacterized protein LOC105642267 isoform X2 n=1 Tax=Rhizophora mucronata TaxID=61149 RepID=A0A2P2KJ59_RHIMU